LPNGQGRRRHRPFQRPGITAIEKRVSGRADPLIEVLSEYLSDGLLIIDAARRLRHANRRAIALLELPPHWPGCPVATVIADYRLALTVTSCFDHGLPVERLLSNRGREAFARAMPVRHAGRVEEVVVILHDETEEQRLEAIRRDFTANVSHELRTPTTAIKLIVEALQMGALEDRAARAEFVERIGEEARYMARMIEELLELSAIESERCIQHAEPVPVADLLASIDRLRPLADDRGVSIDIQAAPGLAAIHGEPLRLGQLVRNLVHNAIKFSPAGATVEVTARVADDDAGVEIRVSDSGPGIEPDDLARVFERFWKGDASRQRDGQGSGLGLAIAKRIAEAHGGELVANSVPSCGSTFVLTVPLHPTVAEGRHLLTER